VRWVLRYGPLAAVRRAFNEAMRQCNEGAVGNAPTIGPCAGQPGRDAKGEGEGGRRHGGRLQTRCRRDRCRYQEPTVLRRVALLHLA